VFARAGCVIPLGPDVQHAAEALDAPIELRVYRGGDARFDLYEDENDNYNYERGANCLTPITWNESRQTLTIGPRRGEYPGMPATRMFNVKFVRPGAETFDTTITNRGEVSWPS
jgi:alpha-D-xyloside xylohydrolase